MKNIERIKKFDNTEFSEYIYSVFVAGRLYEVNKDRQSDNKYDTVNYIKWLNEEED